MLGMFINVLTYDNWDSNWDDNWDSNWDSN